VGHWGSLHRATGWIDARVDSAWVYQLVVLLSSGVTTIATGSGLKIVPPCTSSWLPNKEDFSLDSWSSSSSSSMIQSANGQCSNWSSLTGFRFCSSRTKTLLKQSGDHHGSQWYQNCRFFWPVMMDGSELHSSWKLIRSRSTFWTVGFFILDFWWLLWKQLHLCSVCDPAN
jgi:hypothetical protein